MKSARDFALYHYRPESEGPAAHLQIGRAFMSGYPSSTLVLDGRGARIYARFLLAEREYSEANTYKQIQYRKENDDEKC